MKKLIAKLALATISLMIFSIPVFAEGSNIDIDKYLLPRPGETISDYCKENPKAQQCTSKELGVVGDLPKVTWQSGIKTAVKTILGASIIIVIAAVVVSGIMFIMAQGDEEKIKKGKDIMKYAVIGLLIMAGAYGIIVGVSQFNFFK